MAMAIQNDKPSLSVVKQTAFSEANETFQQVEKLRRRIEDIVVRLAGYGAEKCSEAIDPASPTDGALDSLSRGSRYATYDIIAANEALDRLERLI